MHQEMAVPEVNKNLPAELEEIGFSEARATRALHFSGNASIEAAINWIIDHENDADIDEMPLVPVDIPVEPSDLSHISEQVKLRAQQLRDQVRKNQEEEQKKLEKNREKERISAGKELLKAKRMAEDNARKRYIAQYEADKEEKRKAMERIRQKLQQDKAERRRRLGLDVEASPKPANHLLHDKKNSFIDDDSVPVGSTKKVGGDLIRERLRSLRRQHLENDYAVRRTFQTLLIYIRNVSNNPEEEKFRKIRLRNPAFQDRVGRFKEGVEFLQLCGFEKTGEFLVLPRERVDQALLARALTYLNSASTNPFFGLFSRDVINLG